MAKKVDAEKLWKDLVLEKYGEDVGRKLLSLRFKRIKGQGITFDPTARHFNKCRRHFPHIMDLWKEKWNRMKGIMV